MGLGGPGRRWAYLGQDLSGPQDTTPARRSKPSEEGHRVPRRASGAARHEGDRSPLAGGLNGGSWRLREEGTGKAAAKGSRVLG